MNFSERLDVFGTGIFAELLDVKNSRVAEGRPVCDLSVGSPNIPPAPHIIKAMTDAAADPKSYVYAIKDTMALKETAAGWYARRFGVSLDPATEVMSLLGTQEGLAHIAMVAADRGDTVLVPDPCYPVFSDGPRIAEAALSLMPMREENGWLIDFDAIPEETARKAKMMVVSYPNNPTTALAPPEFYKKLIAFAKRYDIIVVHDNAYNELVFDGRTTGSFLAYEGAKDVGVEFNSLSKTYGLAGARIGFCLGNPEVVRRLSLLKSNMDYGMFLPVQRAAIAALSGDQSCVAATRAAYQRRRDFLCDGLSSIGWGVARSASTMFVWARLPGGWKDPTGFAKALVSRTGVMVTPGDAFGPGGRGRVRMALVQDEDAMAKALDAIKRSGIIYEGD